ncbi:MAG: hypothetical protein LRZ85_05610 [Alphaproteobacteria bacterium]|nr:hypothetical protein [Alphaproteobacteria bacterium]
MNKFSVAKDFSDALYVASHPDTENVPLMALIKDVHAKILHIAADKIDPAGLWLFVLSKASLNQPNTDEDLMKYAADVLETLNIKDIPPEELDVAWQKKNLIDRKVHECGYVAIAAMFLAETSVVTGYFSAFPSLGWAMPYITIGAFLLVPSLVVAQFYPGIKDIDNNFEDVADDIRILLAAMNPQPMPSATMPVQGPLTVSDPAVSL